MLESLFFSVRLSALTLCLLWSVLAPVALVGPSQVSSGGCACWDTCQLGGDGRNICTGPLVPCQISQSAVAVGGVWLSGERDDGWPVAGSGMDGGGDACVGTVGGRSCTSGGGRGAHVLTKFTVSLEVRLAGFEWASLRENREGGTLLAI